MGYSPWGHKEWDTIEQLTLTLLYIVTVWVCSFELGEGLGGWNLFPTNNKWGHRRKALCPMGLIQFHLILSGLKQMKRYMEQMSISPKAQLSPLLKQICPNSPTETHIINKRLLWQATKTWDGLLFQQRVCARSISKLCLTLWPTRLFSPWDFPGKNTRVGCHFLLQGIFLTQGSNPALSHCRQILSHQGPEARKPDVTLLDKFTHPSATAFLRHF